MCTEAPTLTVRPASQATAEVVLMNNLWAQTDVRGKGCRHPPVRALLEMLMSFRADRFLDQLAGRGPVRLQLFAWNSCKPVRLLLSDPQLTGRLPLRGTL